ncbi:MULTISPECIES: hypothetical protein [unclassified Xanthobacter]|uniref:hypothetical protein n=1 Tax=unclassified Xanthobacter TaxID=2623496 RepID=UPI001F16C673|nr:MULTISPECIES: hypothetical protein [unclassified Xanthobacter]
MSYDPWHCDPSGDGATDFNWNLDVNYDFTSSVDLNFTTDTNYDSSFDPSVNFDMCIDISGNFAGFNVDVQAVGDNSATEVNLAVVTTDDYSSIALSGYSAVA